MCYNRFVNPARFLCALRAMRPRHAVPLTPLISLRPVFSRPRIQIAHESSQIPSLVFERLRTLPSSVSCKSFPCHTSENSPVSPAIATDPKTPSRKSFACHTSETSRGASHLAHANLYAISRLNFPLSIEDLGLVGTVNLFSNLLHLPPQTGVLEFQ